MTTKGQGQAHLDPSDTRIPIEVLVRKVDNIRGAINGIHVQDQKKMSYPVNCIWHMLEAGRLPSIDELTCDDHGTTIISELDPESLVMSSRDWENLGLPSMGEFCDNVSMYGANLEDQTQAERLKQAFVKFPQTLLSLAIGEVYKKFEDHFQMSLFQCDSAERYSPLQQMKPMQEVMLTIQTRCVNISDEMYKTIMNTCNARPADLSELRRLEINLRSQIQIYEQGKYAKPGSREDEFSQTLCRCQARVESSRFPGATQQAIGNALIRLLDKRAQNKETLTIKQVADSIKAMHIMMHGAQIGKLMEDESVLTERAMVAQVNQQTDTNTYRTRNGKPRMSDQEYCQMLKEENLALKNQVRQLKNSSERAKSSVDAGKTSTDASNADESKAKANETKRKREQAKKVTPMLPAPQVSSPPTRVSGFMLAYSNGKPDTEAPEEEDIEDGNSNTKAFAYIARVRVPNLPDTSNVENEKPSDLNISLAAPSPEGVCARSKRRCLDAGTTNMAQTTNLQSPEGTIMDPSAKPMPDSDSDSIPDLIEDDEEPVHIAMTSVVYAKPTKILTHDMVYTQVFPDDQMRKDHWRNRVLTANLARTSQTHNCPDGTMGRRRWKCVRGI